MGIEQSSNLQMRIVIANNQVFAAQSQRSGSADHAKALIELAQLLADHREGPTILKDLNNPSKK